MPPIHRLTDSRICGHTTVVVGNSTVFANNLLVSVNNDPDTAGGGNLIAASRNVYVENIMVVNHTPDMAKPDKKCPAPPHCTPITAQGSPNVFVGD